MLTLTDKPLFRKELVASPPIELPEHGYTALPPETTVEGKFGFPSKSSQREMVLTEGDGFLPKGRVNIKTTLLAVFGTLGAYLVVAAAVLMLQRWRRRNAAKMFECVASYDATCSFDRCLTYLLAFLCRSPPPADRPPFYS